MKWTTGIAAAVLTVMVGLAAACAQAASYQYLLNTPRDTGVLLTPYTTAGDAAEFFNMTARGPVPEVNLKTNQVLFFLHEDSTTGSLGFGMFIDRTQDGSGGFFGFDLAGAPTSARFAVRDNPKEPGLNVNGTDYDFRWNNGGVDGFATYGFENAEWSIIIDDFYSFGITQMAFLLGGGTRINMGKPGKGPITLSATEVGAPSSDPTPVPLPSGWTLLGSSGVVLVLKRRLSLS